MKPLHSFLLIGFLPLLMACHQDPDAQILASLQDFSQGPVIITAPVTDITGETALCAGVVLDDAGKSLLCCGICYATASNPTLSDEVVDQTNTKGGFKFSLTGLKSGTTYYVRAWAASKEQTYYGAEQVFTTLCVENGYQFVDLGLSVKWAPCNLGAAKPQQDGDYYAWGATGSQTYIYSVETCADGEDYRRLLPSCDVASVTLGGAWRMPTMHEWAELRDNCIWTWTRKGLKAGYEVKSRAPGNTNSIFLPASGYWSNSGIYYGEGGHGYYWSSSLDNEGNLYNVYALTFNGTKKTRYLGTHDRSYRYSIRPVCP